MKKEVDFIADYILENDHVLLRPLRISDFVNLINLSVAEPELWQFSLISAAGGTKPAEVFGDSRKRPDTKKRIHFYCL